VVPFFKRLCLHLLLLIMHSLACQFTGAGDDTLDSYGDVMLDFTGAGVSSGNRLLLQGDASGAKLINEGETDYWSVQEAGLTVDRFTLTGVTKLIASDYAFIL